MNNHNEKIKKMEIQNLCHMAKTNLPTSINIKTSIMDDGD
jgi:hypothetical protein